MKKLSRRNLIIAIGLLTAFALWTAAIRTVDVQPIGPEGTAVGFATLNGLVHDFTGVHMQLYTVTDWLGLVPILFALCFAALGLIQWISRKSILKVDRSLFVLGGFYLTVVSFYVLFEFFVINYRPILIEGHLESSYPSSTTMLVLCVMPTAVLQFHNRIANRSLRRTVCFALYAFTAFMVIGRLISGVHWFTDIIGGVLLSAGLVMAYHAVSNIH